VDGSRPCLAAFHTKNEQAHLWILIYVCMHIPQTSAAISGLLVAVWVPARQILHRNIVWGPRAGIIFVERFASKHFESLQFAIRDVHLGAKCQILLLEFETPG